ncbi:hypothetical protein BT96DRAFT_301931 [Gymnopus androsaceus JB14]|uniref:DNA polymerase epsilon subunit D n=1 Tax=Gymnopus androsaceus JB14 TaxID=1447944 RepID=A0A6A4H1M6_9AGAR|nr:hypothetical protein BT96DRAFT_301931 [Gymnopus androsaceus JB14]
MRARLIYFLFLTPILMPRKEVPLSAQQQQDLISEGLDNFELPKDLVTKIAKSAVPDNTKLQKEVLLSLGEGFYRICQLSSCDASGRGFFAFLFVLIYLRSAHDVAQSKQHKSIAASDVLRALELCELGDLVEPLSAELQVYRGQGKAGSASVSASAQQGQSSTSIINFKTTTSSSSKSKAKEREKPLSLGMQWSWQCDECRCQCDDKGGNSSCAVYFCSARSSR